MMKLCRVIDHQNKSRAYREALARAGYLFTERELVNGLRFILSDADWRQTTMANAAGLRTPVFLYPHAARPMVQYDGCVEPQPVRCMFTQAPGGKELMKIIGYPNPVEVTGWAYSEVRSFRPVKKVERVLFAPIHPNANGYLNQVDKDLNRRTYRALYDMCQKTGAQLSIRLIGTQTGNGLDNVPTGDFVEWHQGRKNNTTADMDTADVVVAHQTFAYLAVALGVPTVMMGEDVPPRSGNSDAGFCYVAHWDDYKADLMYPLDILQGDPADTIAKACEGSDAVEEWKARYIGKPFDGPAFVAKLESYL
jgi:hypothetical protein